MESTSIMNSTMGDLGGYFVPQKYYDPNSSARILCIELPNNSQIFLNYSDKFTVTDVIKKILDSKEFRHNSYNRDYILDSHNHINLYDLLLFLLCE